MKRTWVHFLVAIVLLQVAPGQESAPTAPTPLAFENGIIAKGAYTNECFGFSFTIPDNWQINTQIMGAEGKAKHLPGGGLVLLVLDQRKEKPSGNRIVVTSMEANGIVANAQQFVSNSVRRQIETDPERRQMVRQAFQVDQAGKHFFRADYKQSLGKGGDLYLALVYTEVRGFFLGETLIAGSHDELDEFANSLKGMSFRDDEPASCAMHAESEPNSTGIVGGVIGSAARQSPSGQPPLRVRVSQGVSQGLLVKRVNPQYPEEARHGRIQGQVVLQVQIDKNGDMRNVTLVSGHPLLAPPAIEAVKQWKYKPYLLEGQPVAVDTQVIVNFTLSGG